MKMPGQPSSDISFQSASAYEPASANSRSFSGFRRAPRKSCAVDLIACWSSVKSSSSHPRQSEHALGDDVAKDLRGAALDRVRSSAEEAVGPLVVHDRPLWPAHLGGKLGHRLIRVRPLPLHKRSLRPGYPGLHLLGEP